jgi:hypothetical protein
MNRYLLALALIATFSAPAWAAVEKPARPDHRHIETTFTHQWRAGEAQSRSVVGSYWQPCNSTFHSYIVNNCD